jgi:hypothetical protein
MTTRWSYCIRFVWIAPQALVGALLVFPTNTRPEVPRTTGRCCRIPSGQCLSRLSPMCLGVTRESTSGLLPSLLPWTNGQCPHAPAGSSLIMLF